MRVKGYLRRGIIGVIQGFYRDIEGLGLQGFKFGA